MYIYDKEKLPSVTVKAHENFERLYDKAWQTAFVNIEYIDKEGWKPQLTCMPGVNTIWQWDSCFMTLITNYSNSTLSAFNNLDNLYRLRRESDGYMSMAYRISTESEAFPGRINPPIMAWAEWEHYRICGDDSRLAGVLPALEGCYSFIENNRRRNCGLYWFEDSGSSGMDNSPRSGYPATALDGNDVCHIDLACQQSLSAKCIAQICEVLGLQEKADFYFAENKRINELINRYHWSEKAGCYFDFFARGSAEAKVKFINSKTVAMFWTLLCGCAQGEKLERLVEHMFNENEFYTEVPFASLSKDDPNYDQTGGYWLGGVWPPTNYVAIRGLSENGYGDLARKAALKFLEAMCDVNENEAYGGIWECYAPEAHAPSTTEDGRLVRPNFVGWGGLFPITSLIETVIGLELNAPENTVVFNLYENNVSGISNLDFCGAKISVNCSEYKSSIGGSVVEVECEKPFRLIVKTDYLPEDKVIEVAAGKHVFNV